MLRRRRREGGEERQLAGEANTAKRHANILSREILFSKLGVAGADNAVGLSDFASGHYKPPKDWRTERPASTSVLLGPPREMMVAGNDSDQYFGWRVPTPLVQGLTGTGRLVPRFRYTKHMLA